MSGTPDSASAAERLAERLNAIDAAVRSGRASRAERAEMIDVLLTETGGDQREIDLIALPEGSRVCWHIGARGRSRWVVERRGERCAAGDGSAAD